MKLSPKKQDVLTLLACGLTDKEVANKLHISDRTVQTHVSGILLRLGAKNRTHAVALYMKFNPKWKIGERFLIS